MITHAVIDIEANVKRGASRGRPNKKLLSAGNDAAHIVDTALLIKLGRKKELESAGFTEATALRYVMKRRRGLIGGFIGDSVRDLVSPTINHTERALQLIIEHGVKVSIAALALKIDLRNLRKALPLARIRARNEAERRKSFAKRTFIVDLAEDPFICHETPLLK